MKKRRSESSPPSPPASCPACFSSRRFRRSASRRQGQCGASSAMAARTSRRATPRAVLSSGGRDCRGGERRRAAAGRARPGARGPVGRCGARGPRGVRCRPSGGAPAPRPPAARRAPLRQTQKWTCAEELAALVMRCVHAWKGKGASDGVALAPVRSTMVCSHTLWATCFYVMKGALDGAALARLRLYPPSSATTSFPLARPSSWRVICP